jgi:hypothetical protein
MALANGQAAISVYVSTELLETLKAMAAAEDRSLSNFVARELARIGQVSKGSRQVDLVDVLSSGIARQAKSGPRRQRK